MKMYEMVRSEHQICHVKTARNSFTETWILCQ